MHPNYFLALLPLNTSPGVSSLILGASLFCVWYLRRPELSSIAPKWWKRNDWPFMGAISFYHRRRDFFLEALQNSQAKTFSFYVGKKHVIGMSGPLCRKVFYESRGLSLADGAGDLITGHPSTSADMDRFVKWFKKTFTTVMRGERLGQVIPLITHDTRAMFNEHILSAKATPDGEWRIMNPFETLYEIIYQLTIRLVGPRELAEDSDLRTRSLNIIETIEHSKSTLRVVFPWFPTPTHIWRTFKNIQLGLMIYRQLQQREKTKRREDDTMQALLDLGTSTKDTVAFLIGALFAGQLNTGINTAWIPVKLAQSPYWMSRVRHEVDTVVAEHRKDPEEPAAKALGHLDLDGWEKKFPVVQACLRECIRLALTGSSFRKNISGQDIPIGDSGEVIPANAYATYLHDELHMDPDIYPDPFSYDPGRFLSRDEGKNVAHGYIGWGSGLHPCIGMRIAKLEVVVVLVHFVAMYDFQLSDKDGNLISDEACPIKRDVEMAEKPHSPTYLRYRVRSAVQA